MNKIFIYLFSFILLIGCSTQNQPKYKSKVDFTPSWVLDPSKERNICSVGSAHITEIKTSHTIALLNAKANISREINLYIQTQTMQTTDCDTKECRNIFDSKSSQQSTQLLKAVKVIDSYTDEKNNILYVRACCKQ